MIKGNLFRGVHADGVWGGITPQGQMAFTFYSERMPIPQQLTHEVREDGSLGSEVAGSRVGRTAIVREAEVCVYMNPEVARAFQAFIGDQLAKIDELVKARGRK